MSIRRQRVRASESRLASACPRVVYMGLERPGLVLFLWVLLAFSGFNPSIEIRFFAHADSKTNSVSTASPSLELQAGSPASSNRVTTAEIPGTTQRVPDRVTPRPRPAFWQGDTSLTEGQKTALRNLTQAYRQENKPQLETLQRLRRELEELVFAMAPDPAAIQAKASELAKVEGQLAVSRSQLIQKLRPQLSSDQLERLKSLRGAFELSDRFSTAIPSTNRNTLPRRPRKSASEPDASGSTKPKE